MSFSFGTNPTFGTPTNTFGTPTSTFGTPTSTFGTPTSTFGAPSNTFGTPTSTFGTAQPNLGIPPPAQPSLFGTPNTQQGLSFGAPPPAAQSTGLFGNVTPASTGLSFGTPTFPAPSVAATSLTVPTISTAPGSLFGAYSAPVSTGTLIPSLQFGNTGTAGTPALNFGAPAATTSSGGLLFGGTPVATSTVATPSAPVGLGGIAASTPTSSASSAKAEQAPKEQHLPNEIQQTVDGFKNFVKLQKSYSSDVARCSIKELMKVQSNINDANDLLNEVEKQLDMNKNIAEKLKYDTARGLQQVEMAQRTYDTPLGLQYDNNAPLMFFLELVDNFEREMQNMKSQIENTDKYVKHVGKPTPLNSQDLSMGLRRIHETFVALAGRLQAVHSQVETQKEQYLNFRKNVLNDSTNVFEKQTRESDALNVALNSTRFQSPKIGTGPTPFSAVSHPSVVQAAIQNAPPPAYQPTSTFGGFSSSLAGGSNLFGNTSFGYQPFNNPSPSAGFQLQKPPTGNKRGKQ